MPNIIELNQWEPDVYQLETNDIVMGGADGIDNVQAKQLANRTQYLKAQQEAHAIALDPHPQYMTTAESEAAIAAAVALLVNSSPAALDTLAELATALGNDPNFATTLTNALAAKATWASVDAVLTAAGIVIDHNNAAQLLTALRSAGVFQTAAQFDNTTKPATTAFCKAIGKSFAGVITTPTANTVFDATYAGKLVLLAGQGYTHTLPPANSFPNGAAISFLGYGWSGSNTIQRAGADAIYPNGVGSGVTSFAIGYGDTVTLVSNGVSWFVSDGNATQGLHSQSFGASLAASGYQKLPSGLIIQWGGVTTSASADVAWTFPIAFPTGVFKLAGGSMPGAVSASNPRYVSFGSSGASASQAMVSQYNGSARVADVAYLIAIGY